jgi:hypothetical protein
VAVSVTHEGINTTESRVKNQVLHATIITNKDDYAKSPIKSKLEKKYHEYVNFYEREIYERKKANQVRQINTYFIVA